VGVNKYRSEVEFVPEILEIDPKIAERQSKNLSKLKNERNSNAVEKSLSELSRTAEGSGNIMPDIFNCVKTKATLGEISDSLRKIFGEYTPS